MRITKRDALGNQLDIETDGVGDFRNGVIFTVTRNDGEMASINLSTIGAAYIVGALDGWLDLSVTE